MVSCTHLPEGPSYPAKTAFLSHLYIEKPPIILPRQTRDKYRENSEKDAVFRTANSRLGSGSGMRTSCDSAGCAAADDDELSAAWSGWIRNESASVVPCGNPVPPLFEWFASIVWSLSWQTIVSHKDNNA
jgi:hypothetical protein